MKNNTKVIEMIKNNPELPIKAMVFDRVVNDHDRYIWYGDVVDCHIKRYKFSTEDSNGVKNILYFDYYAPIPEKAEKIMQDHMDLLNALYPETDWDEEPNCAVLKTLNNIEWETAIFLEVDT